MRYFLTVVILITGVLSCGFSFFGSENKPYVNLTSNSMMYYGTDKDGNPVQRIERKFAPGQRIFYTLVAPKGFKDAGVRFKIVKHEEKTSNWGYSIIRSKDIYLDLAQKSYQSYFVLTQKGHYIVEFYYVSNLDYPFARNEFWIN